MTLLGGPSYPHLRWEKPETLRAHVASLLSQPHGHLVLCTLSVAFLLLLAHLPILTVSAPFEHSASFTSLLAGLLAPSSPASTHSVRSGPAPLLLCLWSPSPRSPPPIIQPHEATLSFSNRAGGSHFHAFPG